MFGEEGLGSEDCPETKKVKAVLKMLKAQGKCYCALTECMSDKKAEIEGVIRCLEIATKGDLCEKCLARMVKEFERIERKSDPGRGYLWLSE